jgi:hypothetical protein
MEKMLSEELKKDKAKAEEAKESDAADSSSESTENSEHKRYLTQHWKELKVKRAAATKASNPPSVETVSSTETKSIESPPRNRSSKSTSTVPEDWETLDDYPTSPSSTNIEQLSPLRATATPFEPSSNKAKMASTSSHVTAADYECNKNCPVTAILEGSHDRIKGYLADLHNNNPSFTTAPNQSPFQVNYDDGEFIVLNCTGSQVATLPESITDAFPTDQANSLDSPDLTPNKTAKERGTPSGDSMNSRERRKQRRQQPGRLPVPKIGDKTPDQWLTEVEDLPPSVLHLLYEQVLFDYPNRDITETSSAGISGTNYECSLQKYQNGKPLSCSSKESKKDAKDKLLGFLLARLGGLQPQSHYCKVSQSYQISSNFTHYVSTWEQTDQLDPTSRQDNQDSMSEDEPKPGYSVMAAQWWQSIVDDPGQIDSFKFGGRNVHLRVDGIDVTPEDYDTKMRDHPGLMRKIGWNRPDAPKRIYRVRVERWAEDHDLCADSEISCLDAYLKALCYSELHDRGGTSSKDGPEDNDHLNFRQVPQDFLYYPSTFSEKHPELTAEIVSQWWRDALTTNSNQTMEEDEQPSAPPAAQGMTSAQGGKESGSKNSSTPSVDPEGCFDRFTN